MEPWLDCLEIPAKLLIHTFVTLRDYFVGVVNETAAYTGHPCSHTTATFTPVDHALSIAWHLVYSIVNQGKLNVFRLTVKAFILLVHKMGGFYCLKYYN